MGDAESPPEGRAGRPGLGVPGTGPGVGCVATGCVPVVVIGSFGLVGFFGLTARQRLGRCLSAALRFFLFLIFFALRVRVAHDG